MELKCSKKKEIVKLEIREVRDDERELAFYIGSQAFMQGSRDMSRLNHPDRLPRKTYGVWDDAGLQAMVGVIEYEIQLGARVTVPMGGVAAVACLPASRGKGYAGECIRYSLERMRDAGQVVSVLFPFSFEYYDRFGWAWVGIERNYEVPTRILQAAAETEDVRAATDADRPAIAQSYSEFASRYRGAVVREEKLWNSVLNSSETQFRFTYLYAPDDRVEGYLTYIGGKRDETKLREMISLTPRARRALLGLLRRHEMQISKFTWNAPSDDLLWSTLFHWDLKTNIAPVAQARIVDLRAALAAWKPDDAVSGSVVAAVTDANAPWNQGTWRIEFEAGRVNVAVSDANPQVSLDIRALSQAYFGTPTMAQIRAAEQIEVHDEAGYLALESLLAGPPMWMADSF
jgi:predicted acetyltransferase